jgi:hypothetical protein
MRVICMYMYMQWTSIILMVMRSNFLYVPNFIPSVWNTTCIVRCIACMPYRETPTPHTSLYLSYISYEENLNLNGQFVDFLFGTLRITISLSSASHTPESVIKIIGSWSPGAPNEVDIYCFDPHICPVFVRCLVWILQIMNALPTHQWQYLRINGLIFNIKTRNRTNGFQLEQMDLLNRGIVPQRSPSPHRSSTLLIWLSIIENWTSLRGSFRGEYSFLKHVASLQNPGEHWPLLFQGCSVVWQLSQRESR